MRRNKSKAPIMTRLLATSSGAAVFALLSLPVAAETAASNGTGEDLIMNDVIVTAQKRSESLLDVPISITALSEEELIRQGAQSIDDVARITPGLTMVPSARGYSGTPIIRGIASLTAAPTVGIYINDTPVQTQPSIFAGNPSPFLFDIDRVEVLRGPQGTLYGSSSMGGTIRYVTKTPSYTDYSGRIFGEVADTDGADLSYQLAGAMGGPIVKDKLAARVSASYRQDGGLIERVDRVTGDVVDSNIDSVDTFASNLALSWQATENLEIRPALFFQTVERDDMPNFQPSIGEYKQFNTSPQPGHDRFYIPSLTMELDLDGMSLTSVSSLLRKTEKQTIDYSNLVPNFLFGVDFFPGFEQYFATSVSHVEQNEESQEIRLASDDDGRLSWIVGGFYRKSDNHFTQFVEDGSFEPLLLALTGYNVQQVTGIPLLPGSGVYAGNTNTVFKEYAVFGEGTYAITPALKATLGMRVSRSSIDLDRYTEGPLNGGVQSFDGSQEDTPVTPKASISYESKDGSLFYATAQRGYRAGGVNAPVPASNCAADLAVYGGTPPGDFDSDSLWSYETGAKGQFLNRKLAVNASAYWIDWENIQQPISLPNCGFGFTDNLGSARSRGFELEAQAIPLEGLTIGARVGYTDAELTETVLAPADPITGIQAVIAGKGDPIVGVPEWSVSFSGEYIFRLRNGMDAYVRGNYQWLDSYYRTQPPGRVGHMPLLYEADSYEYASLRFGLMMDGGWDVSAFVNNLTDDDTYIGASTGSSPATGRLLVSTQRPRTIGLSVGRAF